MKWRKGVDNFSCIILAAGKGTRYGSEKQFAEIDGVPIWQHVSNTARKVSNEVLVVGIDVSGGITRQHSVYNGLKELKCSSNRVVVLEAARPMVTINQIKTIGTFEHPSCSYFMPSVETVIYKGKYLDRSHCILLQTPQAFDFTKLMSAHEKYHHLTDSTDDTVLMQLAHNINPHLLPGGANLHKITYESDMELMRCLQL